MPETVEQNESYFKMPRRYVDRHRMRRLRAMGVPHLTVAAWYAVMLDIATSARNFGTFSTDVRSFDEACGGRPDGSTDVDLAITWAKFKSAGIVALDGNPGGVDEVHDLPVTFRVTVLDAGDLNFPRPPAKTGAERTAAWKARKKAAKSSSVVTGDDAPSAVTTVVTGDAEKRREEKSQKSHTNQPSGFAPADAVAPAHEAKPDDDLRPLPASQREPAGQIKRAKRDLGSHAAQVILGMIGRRASDSGMLTERKELEEYWRPACELLSEHGPQVLREALNRAGGGNAVRIGFVQTVCNQISRESAEPDEDPELAHLFDQARASRRVLPTVDEWDALTDEQRAAFESREVS